MDHKWKVELTPAGVPNIVSDRNVIAIVHCLEDAEKIASAVNTHERLSTLREMNAKLQGRIDRQALAIITLISERNKLRAALVKH